MVRRNGSIFTSDAYVASLRKAAWQRERQILEVKLPSAKGATPSPYGILLTRRAGACALWRGLFADATTAGAILRSRGADSQGGCTMNNIALRTKKIAFSLAAFVVMLSAVLSTAPAHADGEYYSTWVSGTGSNANSSSGCQASAPCADFSTALAQTTTGGEVNCAGPVDYHNFNTVTITYSVTIDCHDMLGSIFTTIGSNGITINAPGSDVILRNLNLDGWAQHSSIFSGDQAANGILIQAALRVEIFNCKIMNFGQDGISDTRTTGGTELFIKSTIVRGNTGPGIVAAAAATNSVALENVQSVA
ncbi:MAG TPA: hypothetical protein VN938_12020, partial [Xanthobacteraceae bacterium]|nr:hypothetical protein [Xanthobacteraceae bacterium]